MAYTPDDKDRDLLSELERRARESAGAESEDEEAAPDLLDALRADEEAEAEAAEASPEAAGEPDDQRDEPPPDLTIIGYVERHDRPPAFTGKDDQPYTVDVDVEPTDDPDRPYAAFFVFVRWAATGAAIMGHVESEDVAWGETEDEARIAALEASLYDVKAALDAAIDRRERALDDD